ncbi:MAG TPA: Uma2 family endonuclease [Streptosporangiaceae bacterium]|nr:Uma2 family endonuclease [Streptosporangiaceae bacterium]
MSTAPVHHRSLRDLAEAAEEATGLRAEVIGGVIMMSPTPGGKHAGVIYQIRRQLEPGLPPDLVAVENTSVHKPDDPVDYSTPDLTVLAGDFLDSDDWLADPAIVELAVEVVSAGNSRKDTADMPAWYAEAGIPLFLLVDPRLGTWTLYSHPSDGAYQGVLHGKYAEPIPLPAPVGMTLDTGSLPRYADGGR